jgi:cell division protease FtsH
MLLSRSALLARYYNFSRTCYGASCFGNPEVQLVQVMIYNKLLILHKWLPRYGMSNIGPIALEGDNDVFRCEYNEAIADRIDTEVCKIINHCEQIATEIVLDNRVVIDLAVENY